MARSRGTRRDIFSRFRAPHETRPPSLSEREHTGDASKPTTPITPTEERQHLYGVMDATQTTPENITPHETDIATTYAAHPSAEVEALPEEAKAQAVEAGLQAYRGSVFERYAKTAEPTGQERGRAPDHEHEADR